MYLPGLPALTHSLHASASAGQLTLTSSVLGIAVGQLLFGAVSDANGRRLPLLSGIAAFGIASVLCALAPAIWLLVIVRFLQGLAGGAGVVVARAVVRDVYTGNEAAHAFATTSTINGLSPIIAPLLGGAILTITSWPGVFVALALIGACLFLLTLRAVPETLPPAARHTGGLRTSLRTFGELLTDRHFAPAAATYALCFGALFAYISGGSFVLENIYHVSPQAFSAIFAANSAGIVSLSLLSRRLVRRTGPHLLLRAGVVGGRDRRRDHARGVCDPGRSLDSADRTVHHRLGHGAGAAERGRRGDGRQSRRARERLGPARAQPVRSRCRGGAARRSRRFSRRHTDGDRDDGQRRVGAGHQSAADAARRLAPDLVCDLDDQLELRALLVERQVVALLG